MKNKFSFGIWESSSMIISATCTQIFLSQPRLAAEAVGTAGWLLMLYTGILAFIFLSLILKLYKSFEGKDIVDIAEIAAGGVGRTVVGCITIAYLLFVTPLVLREFAEDFKVISLTQSPISFVILFFVIGMVVCAYIGIEALVRFASIVIPLITIGFVLILIGVIKFADLARLAPILGNGPKELFIGGMSKISIYTGTILLFWMAPYIKGYGNFVKIGRSATVISCVFLTVSSAIYLAVYPYAAAVENFLPMYQMSRLISFGRFFQRIESIFILFWGTSAFIYLSMGLYFAAFFFKKAFNLKYYKPMIIPFGILIFAISLIPENLLSAIVLETKYFRNLAWIIVYGVTTVVLLAAKAAKKRSGREVKR